MNTVHERYEHLLGRLIDDGIAEVTELYTDPAQHHKRDGAIAGFEGCRAKRPDQIVDLWKSAEKDCHALRVRSQDDQVALHVYWKKRYEALQYEWVLNVLSAGLIGANLPPLAPHLPTVRGMIKYAQIMGTTGGIAHGPDYTDDGRPQ